MQDSRDFDIIRENIDLPFSPFHRATYGMSASEYMAFFEQVPYSMKVARKLQVIHGLEN